MAQAAEQLQARGFDAWFKMIAAKADIDRPTLMQQFLVRNGMQVGERTVERWWKGFNKPQPHQVQEILHALDAGLPDAGVLESYFEWLKDRRFDPPPTPSRGLSIVP